MREKTRTELTATTILVLLIIAFLINPLIIMLTWNYLIPWLFVGAPTLTFGKAIVVSLLTNALFGKTSNINS